MKKKTESGYIKFILQNMPRVLTQIDRDKDSITYGSCDRNYWHLKIRDFSSAILQQTSLTLALAYKYDFKGNVYYNKSLIKEWSISALKYLDKIQLKDGSFNEYYPNEHGFPPTAFLLFTGSMTYIELGLDDKDILKTLHKAALWLVNHTETKAYNQEIASITGLYLYNLIEKDKQLANKIDLKLSNLLKKQSKEGWFMEQGGADIGYLSVSLDMLSEYYLYSKNEKVLQPIFHIISFLQFFVHPDGTVGGEYASRNTIYFMPNGLENVIGLDEHTAAAQIAMAMKEKIYLSFNANNHFMDAVDERYLLHYIMHSYLRAQKKNNFINHNYKLPFEKKHYKIFQEAGLVTIYNGKYYAVISTKKGGTIKVFSRSKDSWIDCGYRSLVKPGTIAVTNWLDQDYEVNYKDNTIIVNGSFNVISPKIQNPVYHLGLRIVAALLGNKLNKIIKKFTIYSNKHNKIKFERKIFLYHERIVIHDMIDSPKSINIKEADNNSLRLVASGKFFSFSDLIMDNLKQYENVKKISIIKQYDVLKNKLYTTIQQETKWNWIKQ